MPGMALPLLLITDIACLVVCGIAVVTDLRARLIPNWLTFSGVGLGVLLNLVKNASYAMMESEIKNDNPMITIINNVPVVLYLSEFDTDEFLLMQTNRQTGSFSTPVILENRASTFDSLILYNQSSSSYENKTTEASNAIAGDLYHSVSTSLSSVIGDKVYCGSDLKFRFIRLLLSTVGVGGTVSYAYFDGANWKSFVPSGGVYDINSSDKELLLWDDFDSMPEDWQKNSVDGVSRFWVKIEVTDSFSTAPIGSQCTSISNLKSISTRR